MNIRKSALLVIDMQYDFMSGGSLEVKNANKLIEPVNRLMKLGWGLVAASKDWHPENHISFASNHKGHSAFEEITLHTGDRQVLWPAHCIQHTHGAEIHREINREAIDEIIYKGQNLQIDSYSAFFDNNHLEKTAMDDLLKKKDIEHICVVGLARDYCVKWTAMDGRQLGYHTYFIFDATKPVHADTDDEVRKELKNARVKIVHLNEFI